MSYTNENSQKKNSKTQFMVFGMLVISCCALLHSYNSNANKLLAQSVFFKINSMLQNTYIYQGCGMRKIRA